jgi:Protein of unknown function, DUF481
VLALSAGMALHRTSLPAAPAVIRRPGFPGARFPSPHGLQLVLLLGVLLGARTTHAEKTDIVVLKNGDHFTGEIKGMSRGKLDFKTDDVGRISIEWLKVARVVSIHPFEVELASGAKYYGVLQSPVDESLQVGAEAANTFPLTEVITVTPMDDYFWARVKAYLDLGFTLAKSNQALTLSGDGEFAYRGQHFGGALDFNTYIQNDKNTTAVGQGSVNLTGTYYFTNWRVAVQFGGDHNDELDLKLRLDLSAGVAYPLFRNKSMEFWLSGGLIGVRELYTSGTPNLNLAAYIGGEWQAFRYDSPKLDSTISVQLIPVLSELWRTRGNISVKVKYELFYNFNVGINFTYTFDTEPPDPTAAHTDYLLSLTIGWTYRE